MHLFEQFAVSNTEAAAAATPIIDRRANCANRVFDSWLLAVGKSRHSCFSPEARFGSWCRLTKQAAPPC